MSIPVLGRDEGSKNPLVVLANVMERQTQVLAQIAENTAKEGRHIYAYEEVQPGMWMGYCLACSEAAKRFVHPCLDAQKAPTSAPPASFEYTASTTPSSPLNGD